MFTGIIEDLGTVTALHKNLDNLEISIQSKFTAELKIDQSVSHNGVCLTVVEKNKDSYVVTAIKETLEKTNLGKLKVNTIVNLERGLKLGDRLDGHIVQGHVDQTAVCTSITNQKGSWIYSFQYDKILGNVTIEKGSITVNGVSLTVINSKEDSFSVAIIPYTYKNTNFQLLEIGDTVNLEFDVIGKYVSRLQQLKC